KECPTSERQEFSPPTCSQRFERLAPIAHRHEMTSPMISQCLSSRCDSYLAHYLSILPNMIEEFLDEQGPRRCHASIVRTNLCWMYSPVNNRGLQVNELFVFLHRSCQSKPRRSIDERNPPWLMKASDSLQRAMPHHNTRGRNEKVLPQ